MRGDPAVLRSAAFYIPLSAALAIAWHKRPDRARIAGAALATLWAAAALLAMHPIAVAAGWWDYDVDGATIAGLPADLWLGWSLVWGALPVLLTDRFRWSSLLALLWLDLLVMPALTPVVLLGPRWFVGDVAVAIVALLPAAALGSWTANRERLPLRATMQCLVFSGLVLGVFTTLALEHTGGSWRALRTWHGSGASILAQLIAIAAIPGIAAVIRFARDGGGTPFPWDPPERLVRTGPYAFVANPMQVSMVLVVLGWACALRSFGVAALAITGAAFAAGIAAWHEHAELESRLGQTWTAYRGDVRVWVPHLRPRVAGLGHLYVAADCATCRSVARWFARRDPVSLLLLPAEPAMRRITYVDPNGRRREGVGGVAGALEHLHLGWALLGWTADLPFVTGAMQLIVDAVGGGPRSIVPSDGRSPAVGCESCHSTISDRGPALE